MLKYLNRVGTGMAIYQGTTYIQKNMHKLKVPYLLYHGSADRMAFFIYENSYKIDNL